MGRRGTIFFPTILWCWVLVLKRQRPAFPLLLLPLLPPPVIITLKVSIVPLLSAGPPFRHTPHTLRGPLGSSTEGPSGHVRMRPRFHFGTSLAQIVAPNEAPPRASDGRARTRPNPFRHILSRDSWPQTELNQGPQREGSHAVPTQFRHTPQTARGTIVTSTEGPSGRVRMRYPPLFRHIPHTVRGPMGTSTEGPSGRVRMRYPLHVGTPLTRFVAP